MFELLRRQMLTTVLELWLKNKNVAICVCLCFGKIFFTIFNLNFFKFKFCKSKKVVIVFAFVV